MYERVGIILDTVKDSDLISFIQYLEDNNVNYSILKIEVLERVEEEISALYLSEFLKISKDCLVISFKDYYRFLLNKLLMKYYSKIVIIDKNDKISCELFHNSFTIIDTSNGDIKLKSSVSGEFIPIGKLLSDVEFSYHYLDYKKSFDCSYEIYLGIRRGLFSESPELEEFLLNKLLS